MARNGSSQSPGPRKGGKGAAQKGTGKGGKGGNAGKGALVPREGSGRRVQRRDALASLSALFGVRLDRFLGFITCSDPIVDEDADAGGRQSRVKPNFTQRKSHAEAGKKETNLKTERYTSALKKVPILHALTDEERRTVAQALVEMHFVKNDVLVRQGDPGNTFYMVHHGEVGLIQDDEQRICISVPTKNRKALFFGELALVDDTPSTATVKVMSETAEGLALDRRTFHLLLGPLTRMVQHMPATRSEERIHKKDLKKVGLLGVGGFGSVELVQHKLTSDTFAMKELNKGYIVKTKSQVRVMNEKNILMLTNSEFIIKLHETYNGPQALYFLLEAALGGQIGIIYSRKGFHGSDKHTKYYAAGCVLALEHMHKRWIIYRDLKPENLLLTEKGHLKVTDMGLAKFSIGKTYTTCGTPDYFAPELLAATGHTVALDWWTLGILIFEMMTGHPPFETQFPKQLYANVMAGIEQVKFPEKCKGHVGDVMKELLKKEMSHRLPMRLGGVQNLKDHAWFKGFSWEALENNTMEVPYKPVVAGNADTRNFGPARDMGEKRRVAYTNDGSDWDKEFATDSAHRLLLEEAQGAKDDEGEKEPRMLPGWAGSMAACCDPDSAIGEFITEFDEPLEDTSQFRFKSAAEVYMQRSEKEGKKFAEDQTKEYAALLSKVRVLDVLTLEERRQVADALTEMTFLQGDVLMEQGEPETTFYIFYDGELSVTQDGEEEVVRVPEGKKKAHFFGDRAFFCNETCGATVEVLSDTAKALALSSVKFHMVLGPLTRMAKSVPNMRLEERLEFNDLKRVGFFGRDDLGGFELCEHKATKRSFTLKGMFKVNLGSKDVQDRIINEKNVLLMTNSRFIVKLYETYNQYDCLYYLFEPVLGGSLKHSYERRGLHGSAKHARYYAASVVLAFAHLHERRIMYRDLKLDNLYLTHAGYLKVVDFGLAKVVVGKTYTMVGSPTYMAPEVVSSTGQTRAVDWWMLGIMLYELMTAETPFYSQHSIEIYANALKGIEYVDFPDSCVGEVRRLIRSLCKVEPSERLPMQLGGLDNIKEHPWYSGFNWDELDAGKMPPPMKPAVKSRKEIMKSTFKPPKPLEFKDDADWYAQFVSAGANRVLPSAPVAGSSADAKRKSPSVASDGSDLLGNTPNRASHASRTSERASKTSARRSPSVY